MFTPCSLTPSFNLNICFDRDMFSKFLMSAPRKASEKFRYKKKGKEKRKNVLHHFHSPIKNWNLRHSRNSFSLGGEEEAKVQELANETHKSS